MASVADACQVSPIVRGPASLHPWALVSLESRDLLCWLQVVHLLRRQPGEDSLDGSLCSQDGGNRPTASQCGDPTL